MRKSISFNNKIKNMSNNDNDGIKPIDNKSNLDDDILPITDKRSIDYKTNKKKIKSIIFALVPFVFIIGIIYFLASPLSQNLLTKGVPIPELSIEKIEFHEDQIVAFIRNTGHEQITISQADINDRIQSAAIEPSQILSRFEEAKVIIPFPWNSGEPYEIGITTSDGVRFSKLVDVAESTPTPNINQIFVFAMLGAFVGVIPVLIGLSWYPFMRKISNNQYIFFLSLTVGLLVFLGIDALIESNDIAVTKLATTFNGQMLIAVITIITFLGLYFFSKSFTKKIEQTKPLSPSLSTAKKVIAKDDSFNTLEKKDQKTLSNSSTVSLDEKNDVSSQQIMNSMVISLMISIGIGLHNFGEGLAIGAAVVLGESALSTFLIIGFTLHNTTEGLAIVAPLAKTGRLIIKRLILMGLIAGIPTILGTWVGGFIYSPIASIIFLSIGAGAIFQVVYAIISWIKPTIYSSYQNQNVPSSNSKDLNTTKSYTPIIAGIITGMLLMYLTGLLI